MDFMGLNIKNTAKKSVWTSDSISCFSLENNQLHITSVEQSVSRDSIQFFFGMEGESELAFNGNTKGYTLV